MLTPLRILRLKSTLLDWLVPRYVRHAPFQRIHVRGRPETASAAAGPPDQGLASMAERRSKPLQRRARNVGPIRAGSDATTVREGFRFEVFGAAISLLSPPRF